MGLSPSEFPQNYVFQLTAVLDTAVLSWEQRLYLPLYLEVLFESPVLRNGGTCAVSILFSCVMTMRMFFEQNLALKIFGYIIMP